MAEVMRAAGEVDAVRRDFFMGILLIAGTDMPRFRKSKAPSPLVNYCRYAPQFRTFVGAESFRKSCPLFEAFQETV